MKIAFSCLTVILVATFFIGCSDSNSPEDITSGSIQEMFPLKIGNEWVFHYKDYDKDGNFLSADTNRIRISSSTLYNSHEAFQLSLDGDTSDAVLLYHIGTTDLYIIDDINDINPARELHSPLKIGESVVLRDTTYYYTSDTSISRRTLTLKEADVSVTTPAGTFTCYRFEDMRLSGNPAHPLPSGLHYQWYAKGVGLVKQEDYSYSDTTAKYLTGIIELLSYTIK